MTQLNGFLPCHLSDSLKPFNLQGDRSGNVFSVSSNFSLSLVFFPWVQRKLQALGNLQVLQSQLGNWLCNWSLASEKIVLCIACFAYSLLLFLLWYYCCYFLCFLIKLPLSQPMSFSFCPCSSQSHCGGGGWVSEQLQGPSCQLLS